MGRDSPSETDSLLGLHASPLDGAKEGDHNLGGKTLNSFYSFVFIINQIYGPGVLAIPIVFQQAGWICTLLVLTVFLFTSSMCSTLLCEALSLIPGNRHFEKHIEYTGAVKHYFGHRWYMVFQVFLNLCLQSYNIASIIICAQSLDQFMVTIFGKTYVLRLLPEAGFGPIEGFDNLDNLFQNTGLSISVGYLLIMLVCLPSGFLNLADNVKIVQLISFIVLVALLGEFCWQFTDFGLKSHRVPAVGDKFGQLVSVFIFSWAFVMFIPSWVNEKRPDVSVNKLIWGSTICSYIGYICIGLLAAFAYENLQSDDILSLMGDKAKNSYVTVVASYIFSLGVIAPGIPVCLITTRYNLYVGQVCSKRWSYFWGVVAPWLIAYCFMTGQLFADLLNWSSLIFNGIVNFVIPPILYYQAIKSVTPKPSLLDIKNVSSVNDESNTPLLFPDMQPSQVDPWPDRLKPFAIKLTIAIVVVMGLLLSFGIGIDFFYLVVLHQNLIGS